MQYFTAVDIHILMQVYYVGEWEKDRELQTHKLLDLGLIILGSEQPEFGKYNIYDMTEKGQILVKDICQIPLPVKVETWKSGLEQLTEAKQDEKV